MANRRTNIGRPLLYFFVCLSLFFLNMTAAGEEKRTGPGETINITSDGLEADKRAGIITFKGNVVARQEGSTIMANHLTVYYGKDNNIEKIIATGDVRIHQTDRIGTCGKAYYYPDEKRIVMEEEPRIRRGSDMIMGESIEMFMDSDKINVRDAKVIIHPEADTPSGSVENDGQ